MTKEEFADIMLKELKEWGDFINLYDELPWQCDEETIFRIVAYVEGSEE